MTKSTELVPEDGYSIRANKVLPVDENGKFLDFASALSETKEVNDKDSISLLNNILKELKIINIHLSILSDNEIKKTEVD